MYLERKELQSVPTRGYLGRWQLDLENVFEGTFFFVLIFGVLIYLSIREHVGFIYDFVLLKGEWNIMVLIFHFYS